MPKNPSFRDGRLVLGDCLEFVPKLTHERGPFDLIYVIRRSIPGSCTRRAPEKVCAPTVVLRTRTPGAVSTVFARCWSRDCVAGTLRFLRRVAYGCTWTSEQFTTQRSWRTGSSGQQDFKAKVIWVPGNGARRKSGPSVTHQTILIYARGREFTYNSDDPQAREPYASTSRAMHFRQVDDNGRRYRERNRWETLADITKTRGDG